MGQIKWYKRDPRAALIGMAGLSLSERGAYNSVLDLIYIHDGRLPDNARQIAGFLQIDLRLWQRIRKRLIEKGKLYPYAGELHNERADLEVRETLKKISQASAAAVQRWAAYNEIKKLADADALRPLSGRNANYNHKEESLSAKVMPMTSDKKK